MTDQTTTIEDINTPCTLILQQTSGSHDGVQHAVPVDADGHASGEWGDDDDRFFVDTFAPSMLRTLRQCDCIDLTAPVYRIDTGSDAPWTWIERVGLTPPKGGAEMTPAEGLDLTAVKGISESRASALRSLGVDWESVAGADEKTSRMILGACTLTDVDGVGEKTADRLTDYVATFEGDASEDASGERSHDDKVETVVGQIRDGASTDDITSSVEGFDSEILQGAINKLGAEASEYTGVIASLKTKVE